MVHTGRRRGKSRSRVLYWFRTPPGVRVGRSALDEDAIRLLEEYNPDVEFDWTRILKGQPEPPVQPPRKPEPPRRDRAPRRSERGPSENARRPQAAEPPAPPPPVPRVTDVPLELEPEEPAVSDIGGAPSAALARLGPEGLLRLRARYAEVMARISDRVAEPAQRDELKSKAERLNPDAWVTDEEVGLALNAYEATFEELRAVVGRPRRRRRRRGAPPHALEGRPGDNRRTGEDLPAEPGDPAAHLRQSFEDPDES